MSEAETIKIQAKQDSAFIKKVKAILPEGGNLNLCVTCGACASGCPATGLEGLGPRKFLRMAALGMDEEITKHPWVWMCSMYTRCTYVCLMNIKISSDDENWEKIASSTLQTAKNLGCRVYLNTECGHSTYSVWAANTRYQINTDLEITPMVAYYYAWIKYDKLGVSNAWNKDFKIKFTVQDPCNQIRKSYGDEQADKRRDVVKACVGEENFIDMVPNKSNNFCCGGGGGYLQSGYMDARRQYGKIKFDQILATQADYCLTPCHNCHAQIHDLAEHFGGKYHVTHLWTIIALSLGILGENEREYLGDDLKDVWLPGKTGKPNPFGQNKRSPTTPA